MCLLQYLQHVYYVSHTLAKLQGWIKQSKLLGPAVEGAPGVQLMLFSQFQQVAALSLPLPVSTSSPNPYLHVQRVLC